MRTKVIVSNRFEKRIAQRIEKAILEKIFHVVEEIEINGLGVLVKRNRLHRLSGSGIGSIYICRLDRRHRLFVAPVRTVNGEPCVMLMDLVSNSEIEKINLRELENILWDKN